MSDERDFAAHLNNWEPIKELNQRLTHKPLPKGRQTNAHLIDRARKPFDLDLLPTRFWAYRRKLGS